MCFFWRICVWATGDSTCTQKNPTSHKRDLYIDEIFQSSKFNVYFDVSPGVYVNVSWPPEILHLHKRDLHYTKETYILNMLELKI